MTHDDPCFIDIREQLKAQMWLEQERLGDAPHPNQAVPLLLSRGVARAAASEATVSPSRVGRGSGGG